MASRYSTDFETVAASQDQALGPTGNTGDILLGLVITPATTSPGSVQIGDGSTDTTIFTGGATSVADLTPIVINFGNGMRSTSGAWSVITGANVSVVAYGSFS